MGVDHLNNIITGKGHILDADFQISEVIRIKR